MSASIPLTQMPRKSPGVKIRVGLLTQLMRNPLGLFGISVITLVILVALLAPVLAPNSPTALRIDMVSAPLGGEYLLGGDTVGRDILSRLIWSSRNTLLGASIGVMVSAVLGVSTGLLAGYYGSWLDYFFSWIISILMALPTMIVLLAVYQAVGTSIMLAMVAFGVMVSPGFFRLVRSQVLAVRSELYVDAARVSGLPDHRIIGRHILLVVRAPVVIQVAHVAGIAIVMQSGLEFLGLGDPANPTWGGMLQNAFADIYNSPFSILWPGLAIALTVAALMLLGNALRDTIQRTAAAPRAPRRRTRSAAAVASAGADQSGPAPGSTILGVPLADPDDPDTLLSIRELSIGYPNGEGHKVVVHDVNLDVRRGEVLGLVGESGSGKTQTAFATLGLLPAGGTVLDGKILLDGTDLVGASDKHYSTLRGRRIGYVPQEPMSNLDPSFRIGDQLTEPMRTQLRISRQEATRRALELLARVGIPDPQRTFNAFPHEISGGMAQRVLIASAVSCDPDLLIADEPTTALDVTVQAEVLDLLRSLQQEMGMSVLMVTHNFGVVADICDRVAVMQHGRIVEYNDVDALFENPHHEYTQMLLGSTLENSTPREYRQIGVTA